MTPEHTAVVFEEDFELQDVLVHQRAGSPRRGGASNGHRFENWSAVVWWPGEGSDVLIGAPLCLVASCKADGSG